MQIHKKLMKQIRRIIFHDVPVDFAWKQPVRWTVHFPVFPKSQQALLTGSNTNVGVLDRVDGGEMGDDWDANP